MGCPPVRSTAHHTEGMELPLDDRDPSAGGRSVIRVRRSGPLSGSVQVSGAKNSVLKLMAAAVLAPGQFTLHNVPRIVDVALMADLLEGMGAKVAHVDDVLTIDVPDQMVPEAPYELSLIHI